jgi:branched-chain amino acid transport system ATP-binding protein
MSDHVAIAGTTDLRIEHLSVRYESLEAVHDIDLVVPSGKTVALLGANGAGKTSLLRAITGLVKYTGSISLGDKSLVGLNPGQVVRAGVAHVLEGRRIFSQLTVAEHLTLPRFVADSSTYDETREAVLDIFPLLRTKLKSLGGQLSGGQQQMLAVACGLLTRPKVLILDEPSLGLSPVVIDQLVASISYVKEHWDTSLLIAEQSLPLAVDLADELAILRGGRIVYAGRSGSDVFEDEALAAYLGQVEPHMQ